MAKMFYTIEEACAKLGKSEADVRQMVDSGQLSEFRDRDRLMFKAEQVDLLAEAGSSSYGVSGGSSAGSSAGSKGGSSMADILKLADSGEMDIAPVANQASASAVPVVDSNPKEQTGISIFEAEMTEEADPSAVTRVTPSMAGGSALGGSGLLDATREAGDSALGVNAINDAYGTGAGLAGAAAAPAGDQLFEGAASAEAVTPAPLLAAMAEPYDGAGSGLVGGAALGMIVALLIGLVAVLLALSGGGSLLDTLGGNMVAIAGGALGLTLVAAVVGWVIGRKS
jgi:hypothetical protein